MPSLTINYNQLSYAGAFVRPAFSLLAGKPTAGGLYDAFSPFGISLHSITEEGSISSPATVALNIYLGNLGIYKLRLDGVEWKVMNFGDEVIPRFPEVLTAAANWLRVSATDFAFKNHVFVYNGHCALSQGKSKDFLLGLGYKSPVILGEELGNGLIHNWFSNELGASMQFMLDRSIPVEGGLFIQIVIRVDNDNVDYALLARKGYDIVRQELAGLGLTIEEEQEL